MDQSLNQQPPLGGLRITAPAPTKPLPHYWRVPSGRGWGHRAALRVIQQVLIVAVATFLYFFVRGLMVEQQAAAVANATWLIELEQRLGLFVEPTLQRWTLQYDWLVTAANGVYMYGHWPLIAATLTWLLVKHRWAFPLYRTAMLISGAIGLVCFVTFPMAPPRFLTEWGFVDTVLLQTESYRVLQPPELTNQYAAMPSLHVGWNLLMGIALFTLASHRLVRIFGFLMPLAMFAATVLTANHYWADGIAGSLVALTGLAAALLWNAHTARRSVRRRVHRPQLASPFNPG